MVEIHLDEAILVPKIETFPNGLTRLLMSPTMPLEKALQICGLELPGDIRRDFYSLFSTRKTARSFELIDGKLLIRPAN